MMIRILTEEEIIEFSKLRIDNPYKLLWIWLFSVDHLMKEFEYIFDTADINWRIISIKVVFCLPIYVIVGIWKIVEFFLSPFNLEYQIERCFEFICYLLILSLFGFLRLPYAIYTYMRFNRATALIYMLKSN